MSELVLKHKDNINNGMMTCMWGSAGWTFLHCITFSYPVNPSNEQKHMYKQFFIDIGNVLPCRYCRESYVKFISSGTTELTDAVMENRYTVTMWFYLVHEQVNVKLGVNYGVSYEDIVNKYESYRSACTKQDNKDTKHDHSPNNLSANKKGCITPLDIKAESYKNASIKECPVISIHIAEQFIAYAKKRNIKENDFKFINDYKSNKKLRRKMNDIKRDEWCIRNKECYDIITKMRLDAIPSLEQEGRWKGLPTYDELRLILRLNSNLSNDELVDIITKLPNIKCSLKKMYKLTK